MKTTRLMLLAVITFASPALAVDPPPDGGYPDFNTAEGTDALFSLTTGADNAALGYNALYNNTTGFGNTAIGSQALFGNTTGYQNTATGADALLFNTAGVNNTANGLSALQSNTIGGNNTATGGDALYFNTTGSNNTANGDVALFGNTIGGNNTAIGRSALQNSTTGNSNIAVGASAGSNLTTGSNNIDIGNAGAVTESRTIRIGTTPTHRATFIAGINGVTVAGGVGVIIDSSGHLGTVVSSERFKDGIKPMDKSSEAILALKPVTFRYKHELDPAGIPQFGLVAEQVAKVDPDLVVNDAEGKPYTVRYEEVNAMLLNEFLKEHRKVEEQSASMKAQDGKIGQLEGTVAKLQSALEEQAVQIQNVSNRIGARAPVPRVAANN